MEDLSTISFCNVSESSVQVFTSVVFTFVVVLDVVVIPEK